MCNLFNCVCFYLWNNFPNDFSGNQLKSDFLIQKGEFCNNRSSKFQHKNCFLHNSSINICFGNFNANKFCLKLCRWFPTMKVNLRKKQRLTQTLLQVQKSRQKYQKNLRSIIKIKHFSIFLNFYIFRKSEDKLKSASLLLSGDKTETVLQNPYHNIIAAEFKQLEKHVKMVRKLF